MGIGLKDLGVKKNYNNNSKNKSLHHSDGED
jgi:hypothetical protein